jgi:hypothetical protein
MVTLPCKEGAGVAGLGGVALSTLSGRAIKNLHKKIGKAG